MEVKHRRLELKATDELGVRICCSHISNWITDKIATGLGKDVSCTDVPTENYHFSVLLNSVLESSATTLQFYLNLVNLISIVYKCSRQLFVREEAEHCLPSNKLHKIQCVTTLTLALLVSCAHNQTCKWMLMLLHVCWVRRVKCQCCVVLLVVMPASVQRESMNDQTCHDSTCEQFARNSWFISSINLLTILRMNQFIV